MFKYCPKCGKQMQYIELKDNKSCVVCKDSSCRTLIKQDKIIKADIDIYCKLQERFDNSSQNEYGTFMLLKENLTSPMLSKNTNNALMKERNTYNILRAVDKTDALRQFRDKFKVISITEDMVVEVIIREA